MMAKVKGKTRAPVKARSMVYKAVVQEVLLYGRKIWVVTDAMMKLMEGFHRRISIYIMGMTARRGTSGDREWA